MDIDTILANHVEVADGKLFVTGGGVNMCFVGPEPPHVVTLGLGVVVHIPYQLTNQSHSLHVNLTNQDSEPVVPWYPEGGEAPPPVAFETPFNVGRPPILSAGDEQTLSLGANFVNLPMPQLGLYALVVEIDGTEMGRQLFRVMTLPQFIR